MDIVTLNSPLETIVTAVNPICLQLLSKEQATNFSEPPFKTTCGEYLREKKEIQCGIT